MIHRRTCWALLTLLLACGDKDGDSAEQACEGDACLEVFSAAGELGAACEDICGLSDGIQYEYSQVENNEVVLSCTYTSADCDFCEDYLTCNPDPEDTGDGGGDGGHEEH